MVVLLVLLFVLGVQPMVMISALIGVIVLFGGVIYLYMGDMWLGYLLLLVMLSGVMVIFTYMASLSPNESFEVSNMGFVLFMLMGVSIKWGGGLVMSGNFYSFMLWGDYLGGFTLFIIVFLFCIMVIVTWVSELMMGAICVSYYSAWI